MEISSRLDRLDRLVDDFSINSTWPIFDRLDRLHRSTTGSMLKAEVAVQCAQLASAVLGYVCV